MNRCISRHGSAVFVMTEVHHPRSVLTLYSSHKSKKQKSYRGLKKIAPSRFLFTLDYTYTYPPKTSPSIVTLPSPARFNDYSSLLTLTEVQPKHIPCTLEVFGGIEAIPPVHLIARSHFDGPPVRFRTRCWATWLWHGSLPGVSEFTTKMSSENQMDAGNGF